MLFLEKNTFLKKHESMRHTCTQMRNRLHTAQEYTCARRIGIFEETRDLQSFVDP